MTHYSNWMYFICIDDVETSLEPDKLKDMWESMDQQEGLMSHLVFIMWNRNICHLSDLAAIQQRVGIYRTCRRMDMTIAKQKLCQHGYYVISFLDDDIYDDAATTQEFARTMSTKLSAPSATGDLNSLEPTLLSECQLLTGLMRQQKGIQRLWSENVRVSNCFFVDSLQLWHYASIEYYMTQ